MSKLWFSPMITMTCLIGVSVGGANTVRALAGALAATAVSADRARLAAPQARLARRVRSGLMRFPPVRGRGCGYPRPSGSSLMR